MFISKTPGPIPQRLFWRPPEKARSKDLILTGKSAIMQTPMSFSYFRRSCQSLKTKFQMFEHRYKDELLCLQSFLASVTLTLLFVTAIAEIR